MLIERAGSSGIAFTGTAASPAQPAWVDVVATMLELAYAGRAVCLIVPDVDDSRWDLDLREMYPDCENWRVREYGYLCAFDPCVRSETLRAIAKSQDFYLGPIWFATLPRDDRQRWIDLMEAMFNSHFLATWPETSEEVFCSNPDGDWMYWLNPSRPEAAIVDELRRLAHVHGWDFVVRPS